MKVRTLLAIGLMCLILVVAEATLGRKLVCIRERLKLVSLQISFDYLIKHSVRKDALWIDMECDRHWQCCAN